MMQHEEQVTRNVSQTCRFLETFRTPILGRVVILSLPRDWPGTGLLGGLV